VPDPSSEVQQASNRRCSHRRGSLAPSDAYSPLCLRAIGMAVLLAAVAGTASAASQTRLAISGAFHTTSARLVARDESCGFRTKARILGYMSNAMRIGPGPAVARMEFTIPHYRGRGRYDARMPAPYSRTTVQVVTGRDGATGVATAFTSPCRGASRSFSRRTSAAPGTAARSAARFTRSCVCNAAPNVFASTATGAAGSTRRERRLIARPRLRAGRPPSGAS